MCINKYLPLISMSTVFSFDSKIFILIVFSNMFYCNHNPISICLMSWNADCNYE